MHHLWSDDPFILFRSLLFVALAAYFVITTTATVVRVTAVLAGSDPRKRLLRAYLSYQLASIRLGPLADELLQIAFWVTILVVLWWLHPGP